MANAGLSLPDLIDLELQLEADRSIDGEALRARDREIGLERAEAGEARAAQLTAWLDALRAREPDRTFAAASLMRAARLLTAGLALFGFSLGSGSARLLLHFDGVRPVNVLPLLGVLVLAQIGLLLLVLSSVALAGVSPGLSRHLPLLGDVRAALRAAAAWLAGRGRRASVATARFRAILHRLRARSRLHAAIETWWMTRTAQAFGIAFNFGALTMLLVLPSLLKYSFCWSTTLNLGPAALHRLTSVLSWPWAVLWPRAVPSLSLVEATQFDLLTHAYAHAGQPASGEWWPFLGAATLVYGLLPRMLLAIFAGLRLRLALARLPLDTPDVEALLRRLRMPLVETRGTEPTERPRALAATAPLVARTSGSAHACSVVGWRDLPVDRGALQHWLQAQLGWQPSQYSSAGGADFDADERTIAAAAASGLPVVVLAESWEPPDKALRRFLQRLREATGRSTKLAVVLMHGGEPSAGCETELATWSSQLAALEDPYLSVESMHS